MRQNPTAAPTRAAPPLPRFVDRPMARFHYPHAGSGSPVILLLDATALDTRDVWTYQVLKYPVVGELLTDFLRDGRGR